MSSDKISVEINEEENEDFLSPLVIGEQEQKKLFRLKNKQFIEKSVHRADVPEYLEQGWIIQRESKRTTRIKKPKSHDVLLEDRFWCLLYKMGYENLNGKNFNISFRRDNGSKGRKQIDVFACDQETAFVVECKSREERGRRALQKDLLETIALQHYIRKSIFNKFGRKIKIIWAYVTDNIIWSEPDIQRALDGNISVITENELQYYETFIKHMGPAGKFQLLGDLLEGQKISGIEETKIPAIKGKIAGETFYSFVATPAQLLKISFVNHHALNNPDGKPAYQRMISSSRLKQIGKYITDGGYFPTNLIVNLINSPKFEQISNKENTDPNIKFGWLTLPSKYRSAWVIDGQHRLYGYSKIDPSYQDQSLFVLAFDKMNTKKEADLFITINHKQKSVPKSLLVALLADLNVGDKDPKTALNAIASLLVRTLNTDKTSPLFRRFALPGIPAEKTQNLTISEAVNGLVRSGLLGKIISGRRVDGPLCDSTDEKTIERARQILNSYFDQVREANPHRWELGKDAYICTNPGIRARLMLISEIIKYQESKKSADYMALSPDEVAKGLKKIAKPINQFIKDESNEVIAEKFSRKFGEGGVKEYIYNLSEIIHEQYQDFGSEEFREYLEKRDSDKTLEANRFVMETSQSITDFVIDVLKKVHGTHSLASGEPAYWQNGIEKKTIKERAYKKQQEDSDSRRKRIEAYLDIMDLKDIIEQKNNWMHFEGTFSLPMNDEKKGKKYYTGWIGKFNDLRKIAAHPSSLRTYTDDDLEFLDWLRSELTPRLEDTI